MAQEDITETQGSNTTTPRSAELPYTGPRTLAGDPAPQTKPLGAEPSSSSSSSALPRKGGYATLSDLGHSHDDDEEDDDGKPPDLFAGGEKSGLAIQDPKMDAKNHLED